MTLREQASERLTNKLLRDAVRVGRREFVSRDDGESVQIISGDQAMRECIIAALQPLFDQVEREKAEAAAEVLRLMRVFNDDSVARERDDLRAKLTQAEADRDRWSDMADKLHAQVANQRAALDRG